MASTDQPGLFGPRLSRHFGFDRSAVLTSGSRQEPPVAMTYLFSDRLGPDPTPTPPVEPAFSIMVQLAPLDWHSMTLRGAPHFSGPVPPGAVSVVDLENHPRSCLSGRFEAVQFYVPRDALNDLCREHGLGRVGHLVRPRAERDPTAWRMASLLLPHIQGDSAPSPLFVDHMVTAFLAHAARQYGGVDFEAGLRGGLSAGQRQRAVDFMQASLGLALSIENIADAVQMAPRHFAASFGKSFGMPPYRYLTRLRVEEAKRLLSSPMLPLPDIAMRCGFNDQSHFSRVFTKAVGCSPGIWRRLRAA